MRGRIIRPCVISMTNNQKFKHLKENAMRLSIGILYSRIQGLLSQEEGQDLVEYALVVALIALGAITAMNGLSTEITSVFSSITTSLSTAV